MGPYKVSAPPHWGKNCRMVSCEEVNSAIPGSNFRLAIDASVGGENITEVEKYLEQILLWAHKSLGPEPLVQAKEDFYERTGKVFHDDSFFNDRMSYFIDYFIFERQLPSHNGSAFDLYQKEDTNHCIHGVWHSIFSIHKLHDQYLTLRDLISTERHKIPRSKETSFDGITKKDLFQGFIYNLGPQKTLSRGLIFHPIDSHSSIKKYLKLQQKKSSLDVDQVLIRFAKQHMRHLRHGHVNPKLFYQQDPR